MSAELCVRGWAAAERLLCVRLDSMGDVLMTTPAMRALKESAAQRSLTLLASRAGSAVSGFIPEVDDVIEFTAPWMKPGGCDPGHDGVLIEALRSRRFDAAVIFTVYSQSPLPAAYLCYLAGIPLRLAQCRENPYHLLTDWVQESEPERWIRHEVRRHLDLAAQVGCRTADERLSFTVPQRARRKTAAAVRALGVGAQTPVIVVHPGASAPSRRYPATSFARAVDLALERVGGAAVFTGSAEEIALVESVRGAMSQRSYSLAGELGLAELGALLEGAALLIANNTGPVHIAAALGTPVVDLYALTNPQHTPWQVRSEVLFADVPCRFCYKSVCPAGHHRCLTRVPPEAVADAAERLLRSEAAPARIATPLAVETSSPGRGAVVT